MRKRWIIIIFIAIIIISYVLLSVLVYIIPLPFSPIGHEWFDWFGYGSRWHNLEKESIVTPTPYFKADDSLKKYFKDYMEWIDHPDFPGEKILSFDKIEKNCINP